MLDGITASIGVAVLPVRVDRGEDLVTAADAALYQAKQQGRDRIVVSDRSLMPLRERPAPDTTPAL